MDINAAIDNLATALQADAGLTAWRTTHFAGKAFTVIKGNRALKQINAQQVPALIFEIEPMEVDERLLGQVSDVDGAISFGLVWQQPDPEVAFAQRVGLPELIIKAVMTNRKLGGAAKRAVVSKITPMDGDDSAPNVRMVRVTVDAQWDVTRV